MITRAKAFLLALAAAMALAALCGCMGGGNSGSETTNGLTGVVHDLQNAPVAGARILLLHEDHNGARPEGSVKPRETHTDASGAYRFKEILPGIYNLEISDSASGTVAWVREIHINEEVDEIAAVGVLEAPGSVEIPVPDFLGSSRPGYLYLPGTTEYVRVDSAARARGTVILESVAAGVYPKLLLVVEENVEEPITLVEIFQVHPGARTVLGPYRSWTHSRLVTVKPTSGGVADFTVHDDYPFLVRLAAGNFDFSQAARDGRDIRFTDEDEETALPFEIERWDSAAGQAEIWVRLKSIRWDSDAQSITMHWGRTGAASVSSGAAVFASAAGFSSVWHLAEAGNELPGGYRDATAHGNHATSEGINKTSLLDGAVGLCKSFSGDLGTLTAKVPQGFGGDASFTVSFWMKAGMMPTRSNIMNFGGTLTYQGFHFLIRADTTAQFGAHDSDGPGVEAPAAWQNVFSLRDYVGKWTHVALVYDSAARKTSTWMNGVRKSESDAPAAGFQLDAAGGLRIGKALFGATESSYNGQLDEIRFHAAPLPESRIRLDYETQKP